MTVFTIGVYNSTEGDFFGKLETHRISAFCDVRMRRGVRGSKYSFVNSIRLQEKLQKISIEYYHLKNLAPTTEVRQRQKEDDKRIGVSKRKREELGEAFIEAYNKHILSDFDANEFLDQLKANGHTRIVLFCVEERPEACHRSLITDILEKYGVEIVHL